MARELGAISFYTGLDTVAHARVGDDGRRVVSLHDESQSWRSVVEWMAMQGTLAREAREERAAAVLAAAASGAAPAGDGSDDDDDSFGEDDDGLDWMDESDRAEAAEDKAKLAALFAGGAAKANGS